MKKEILKLIERHGTPLFILDHQKLRDNYRTFKKNLPRVQCYYAVKANPHPEIIRTLFLEGSSFDVASYNEFMQIYEYISILKKKIRIRSSGIRLYFQIPSKTRRRWER